MKENCDCCGKPLRNTTITWVDNGKQMLDIESNEHLDTVHDSCVDEYHKKQGDLK